MDAQTQAAYEHGVNELGLHDVEIDVVMDAELDVLGTATKWIYDEPTMNYYVIALLPYKLSLIETLGHELYHVFEFEHDLERCEGLCNAYGHKLAVATGNELHCCACDIPMTPYEAEESEFGAEFIDELVCDSCFASL